MKVLYTFPPNYRAINDAFNTRGKPIIYAYGGVIHNPGKIKIPPQLFAHEAVHLERQGGDPAAWWARYIAEPRFRLDEEIPAHAAEYQSVRAVDGEGRLLNLIAERLASPLYGSLIDHAAARRIIEQTGQ